MTEAEARECQAQVARIYERVGQSVVGLRPLIDRMLIGLLAGGHVLIEGVPGLAKTLAVRAVAGSLALQFSRIQFTPDLLPSDVIGTQVFHPRDGEFTVKRGPVFAQIVLADEINRAPAKVQSALLEAMQERQVTIGEASYPLPEPFMVLATQNPIEQEGTYPLPEAQLDRFLFKVVVGYPGADDEAAIIDRLTSGASPAPPTEAWTAPDIARVRGLADAVHVDPKIKEYALRLIRATRPPQSGPAVRFGASPRAGVGLVQAAKAYALIQGRHFVLPEDIKSLAPDVLRHRLVLSYDAEADGLTADSVVASVLNSERMP
ncbi:MAG: MoxR family ATPase [Gemmataceae bacterium]|nr:MoxR family ATPase [Gemmataceae bacterium]